MDEFQSVQATPQVQFNQNPFFGSFLGKLVLVLVLAILIIGIGLSIKKFPNLAFLPKKSKVNVSQITPPPTPLPADKLVLSCPVPKEFCDKGEIIKDGDKYLGIGYKLPVGAKIFSSIPGNTFFSGGIMDQNKGINAHSTILIGGTNEFQGYTQNYEYFGFPKIEAAEKTNIPQKEELAGLWGGSFPDKSPYNGINILVYLKDSQDNLMLIDPAQLIGQ